MKEKIEARIASVNKHIASHKEWLPLTDRAGKQFYEGVIRCQESEVKFLESLLTDLAAPAAH